MFSNTPSFDHNYWARELPRSRSPIRTNFNIGVIDDIGQVYEDKLSLTYFQSSLFATIIEDTICELQILEECNNVLRVDKTNFDMMTLLARKFDVPQRVGGDELDDVDVTKLECMEYKVQKLDTDRKYLKDVIVGTYVDLSLKRVFCYLSDQVKEFDDRYSYREFLVGEEAKNRVLKRDLARQLRQKRNHIKSVHYDTNNIIDNLRTNVEDAGLNAKIRGRYVDNWQLARTEQHLQTLGYREARPLTSIVHYKQRADQEQRVHTEVELLMNITINETLQKIEEWMDKYDKDIEAVDIKIQRKRNQLEDIINKNEELEKMIEEHARLVKNWVTFKEDREKARLHHENMTSAAITVQAWWRGLLVRNQLGPYKVVKRPPPPAKGGKKKK